jgi:hypothetical protein
VIILFFHRMEANFTHNMTDLFQTTKQNISLHIKNIYEEGELETEGTVKEYLTVQQADDF